MNGFSPAGMSLQLGSAGINDALNSELEEIRKRRQQQAAVKALSPAGNSLLTLGASRFGIGLGNY